MAPVCNNLLNKQANKQQTQHTVRVFELPRETRIGLRNGGKITVGLSVRKRIEFCFLQSGVSKNRGLEKKLPIMHQSLIKSYQRLT